MVDHLASRATEPPSPVQGVRGLFLRRQLLFLPLLLFLLQLQLLLHTILSQAMPKRPALLDAHRLRPRLLPPQHDHQVHLR
jgi:hypothetical protein